MELRLAAILCLAFVLCTHPVSGSYPTAQNVTWQSSNFKTILMWEPKPSADYSYTVEYSAVGRDTQRNLHCIRSSATACDLSDSLTNVSTCYTADVLSEPPLGASSDMVEFPYTSSPRFCPYEDTDIGKPDFKLGVSGDKRTTTLYVIDPETALHKDGQRLNIRDVFSDKLQYKVTYRKNRSTGKKVWTSKTNVIEIPNLDRGVSYCFSVQAYIPSRSHPDKQLGEMSQIRCSSDDNQSFFGDYSVAVIAAAIFLILLLIGIVIAVIVVCCKRRNKALKKEKVPLQDA
ncbi:hypothetical protein Q5P01_004254 [Channa striata]|uniref:Tissue factor n=1 Tax=Channa striata TaxID=64152 RepID=A0AA88T232_CHASR|nr:hypothetical protein Q5P01_004254 [Channa striata]